MSFFFRKTDSAQKPRVLPMGRTAFHAWSDRIIESAQVPTSNLKSLKRILAQMITQLGAQEDKKPDAYFIQAMRAAAAKEVAFHIVDEFNQEKLALIEGEKKKFAESQAACAENACPKST